MKNVKFLFKFKNKLERIVVEGFNKELSFMRALSTTFESIVQSRDSAFAIAIATYIDGKLQSLKKNSDILKLERAFEDTMLVFRSLKGKATFETIYERMLMTRLMLNTSQVESEKKMLTKLQHACGSDYTANLQKIIDDYEMSQNINAEFNCSQAPSSDFSFTVVTVSQQAWSFPTSSNLLLPEEIRDYHRRYEEFFKRCNRGKSLRWAHPLSVCRIEAHLPRGGIEIIANVLQTLVLMLFNSYEKQNWAYDEIAAATNIDEKNLKRTLWTLSCDMGKSLLLKDTPDPNFIDAADIFTYNTKLLIQDSLDLYSRFVRYDTDREIPLQETKARHASSRSYQVDAAIIRVMKSKTKASYHELNDAVTERLVHINPDDLERMFLNLKTRI
ncbi:Cullin family-domain-containing protein [Dichotomocladium elegans]|nr:Cullin family-domain-containing protein [Dichotomocladium elegans]